MDDAAGDKKHLPSAHRLEQLKKKGTVLRSKDMSAMLQLLVFFLVLSLCSSMYFSAIVQNFRSIPALVQSVVLGRESLTGLIRHLMYQNIPVIILMPVASVIAALIAPVFFGGWNLSLQTLALNVARLNPVENLKKVFAPLRAGKELIKSLVKTVTVISVGIACIYTHVSQIAAMIFQPIQVSALAAYSILLLFLFTGVVVAGIFSVVDMVLMRYEFMQQHRMTSKELEDENRESEGSPETKRRIRSTRMMMMRQRIASAVPKASVIITNPSHYAVALRYRSDKDSAPVLLAKGKGTLAAEIRRIALRSHVPIYSAPAIARAVYHTVKIGKQIQPELYMSVAIILSWLRQLESWKAGQGPFPEMVMDFDLPKNLIFKD